jgi:hypothetical protein
MIETESDPIYISPQPLWQEDPRQDDDGSWFGRYEYSRGYDGHDVDIDVRIPPRPNVRPVCIDGIWFWVREGQTDDRS